MKDAEQLQITGISFNYLKEGLKEHQEHNGGEIQTSSKQLANIAMTVKSTEKRLDEKENLNEFDVFERNHKKYSTELGHIESNTKTHIE